MKKLFGAFVLLPIFLFAQTYGALGPSKVFLNSFEALNVFPATVNGFSNFITFSTGEYIDPVGILYKWNEKLGFAVYLNDSSANFTAAFSKSFWDAGLRVRWNPTDKMAIPSVSHVTPFARFDVSSFIDISEKELKNVNLRATKELTEQKILGFFASVEKKRFYSLLSFMIAPTQNRIFFAGIGATRVSGNTSKFITLGAYFPVTDWLYFKLSGDYVSDGGTKINKRLGVNLQYQDFLVSFTLSPDVVQSAPYFLTGESQSNPIISTTILYRFHTF